ncbi:MFS transporter [Ferroglobus sp.]|uniref:MFS transporter n=1 Tax=Ferroglobus sp. TaxID=2614230 RepID=UPI0025C3D687|nr:MFS transporter [Ferroglobus sp.]
MVEKSDVKEVEIPMRELARTIAIGWSGALLEWTDFYTYAILAPIVAKVFFPSEDPIASLLASFGALALGFLFRPLGALLFGRIGDIYGRKIAFVIAALSMLAGTVGIGILPTYAQIGIVASILVFILRIIQGLALGGGYGAIIVFLGESVPERRRGMYTGILFTTPAIGMAIAASMESLVESWLGPEGLEAWGWRIPFIVAGLVIAFIALIMHLFYKETPVFSMLRTVRRTSSAPIRELFAKKEYLSLVLLGWIGVIGAHGPVWYTNQLVSKYFMSWHGISPGTSSAILFWCTMAAVWVYILFGYISDIIGRRKLLIFAIYGNALWFIPAFWLMREAALAQNIMMLYILTYTLTFFNGIGYSGAQSAFLLELFPSRIRVTATGFTYNLGYGITGGLTPFMVTALYKVFNDWWLAVIGWSTVVPMIMGLYFVIKGYETLGTRLWAEFAAEKFAKDAVIVKANEPIRDAIKKMIEKDRRGVVVDYVAETGVAYRHMLKGAAEKGLDVPVGDVAVKVPCMEYNEPLPNILETMEHYHVRMIPVCRRGQIIGMIDLRDVLAETVGLSALTKKPIAERTRLRDVAKEPIVINHNEKIGDAIRLMIQNDIGFLPVVDETGKLVAVFSERDAFRAIANGASLDSPLIDYATKNPQTVSCDDPVSKVAEIMVRLNIRHIVGVDSAGKPVCVAGVKDILAVG